MPNSTAGKDARVYGKQDACLRPDWASKTRAVPKYFSGLLTSGDSFRRAEMPGSTASRMPDATKIVLFIVCRHRR
jgi:hypothetical protein